MGLFKNDTNASTFTLSLFSEITNSVNSSGYKGSKALTVVIEAHSTSSSKVSIGSIVFSASTIGDITSIQYAVIYESGGALLCFCRLSTAGFSVAAGNTVAINSSSGVFTLSGGTTE
jgi:hypothetical protein